MIKTARGRELIDRIARRKRFWRAYGRISVGVTIGSMVALMVLLIWEAVLVFSIPPGNAPSPEMILGIPGLNPIIPLWYGILGLVIAVFIHEFVHGILSRTADIKVKSLGILLLIIPMGAFVEPDEDEIKKTTRQNRARLFAGGPATNMFAAFICLMVLLLVLAPSVKPASPGAIVTGVTTDSPAEKFGISQWSEILRVNTQPVTTANELRNLSFTHPGEPVYIDILYERSKSSIQLPGGVVITSVVAGSPADTKSIKPGMIIESLDNRVVHNLSEFQSIIENSSNSRSVGISVLRYGYDLALGKNWFIRDPNITSIFLSPKWQYYQLNDPANNKDEYKNMSYMGVSSSIFGIVAQNSDYISNIYSKPFTGNPVIASLRFVALPFLGFTPVQGPMADLYNTTGALAVLPTDVYWIILNCFYWVFWLNLMLGLTNALPAVPLDGGYVFRDLLKGMFERLNSGREELARVGGKRIFTEADMDRYIGFISLTISLIVLFLIVWQLIGPRIT